MQVVMENSMLVYSAFSLVSIGLVFALKFLLASKNLPPSPPAIPIIGHLHLLKHPVHRSLQTLSQKYGPIFSLRFGSRLVVVLSSFKIAEECFTKNDVVFANRPDSAVGSILSYNNTTVGSAPYGNLWRQLRRLFSHEILSSSRLQMNFGVRSDEVRRLVKKLFDQTSNYDGFEKVELKSMFKELTINAIFRMVAGKRYYGETGDEAKTFKVIVDELFEFSLLPYAGDFFPILKCIDIHGILKRVEKVHKRADEFWQKLIDEHRTNRSSVNQEMENCVISHFLKLQQESQTDCYNDEVIKGIILTMILAATESTSVSIEWAMSNLLNHPSIMNKARAEIESEIGKDNLLAESDLSKLSYLRSIVLETFRLHPAAPLLIPHRSSDDCTLSEYHIPSNTLLMVNLWDIHRDPTLWNDPLSFKPERFENGEIEAQKLMLPFSMGRRACPGSGLGHRIVGLAVGTLIQCFEWERIEGKEIDMSEGKGMSMPKAQPLEALCKPRPIATKAISSTY